MALQTPSTLEANNGHGIRPFGYRVEFASAPAGQTFPNLQNARWSQRLVKLLTLTKTYGSHDQFAQLSTWDPAAVSTDSLDFPSQWLKEPVNGEAVRIWVFDGHSEKLAFKGTVRGVHENKENNGVIWNFSAESEISRLNEIHFTGGFNLLNDPINPQPIFDADGNKVNAVLFTVRQIVEQILNFRDAWGNAGFFSASSLDWGGLDADPKCGGFIPSQVQYNNTPKGAAIEDVLQKAGNYTFLYDPVTDKIRIIELNRACNNCGPQWSIAFVSTNAAAEEFDNAYAYQYTVKSDKTAWSSQESANVVRMLAGPIRWYSGHSIIPEMATGDQALTVGADTAEMQRKRALNLDGDYYRFVFPSSLGINDTRTYKHYYVGMPLFPDWNIYEDWWPAQFEIGRVLLPPDWFDSNGQAKAGLPAESDYRNKVEFQPFCVGDWSARGETHLGYGDNLRVYQAWFATKACPACKGSGLVRKVYNNADNEPNLTMVSKGNPARYMPEVTNYLMKPSYFGMIPKLPYALPDGTNVASGNPFGLEPFYNDDGSIKFPNDPWTQNTQGYPMPWKNLCPFCRGVGMWPQFKIRDINPDLFAGHNLKVNQTSARGEVPMDPDQTATGPETWEQANMRIALHEDAMLQVETAVTNAKYVLPQYQYRNLPYTDPPGTAAGPSSALANLAFTAVTNVNGTQVTQPVKRWPFPHPLTFNTLRKLMPGATAGQKTLAQQKGWDKIVPDSWKCYVPTTTVQMGSPVEAQLDHKMGRVIFSEALFIPCYKDFSAIQVLGADQKAKLLNNGLLSTATPARGFRTADERGLPTGYWRPARVWLTFCYNRERYFHDGVAKPDGTAIGSIQFNYTNADGIQGQYEARALILDGRYAMEVRKVNPENNSQNVELGFANRTIQAIHEDSNDWTRIEVFEDDYWKMPCPPQPESTQAFTAYVAAKTTTYHNLFPQGMILKWERTTPGEALVEAAGWTDADHFGSFMRPKLFTWYLRDQRPRLLELAVRRLEIVNDVQVSGTLEIVGPVPLTTTGLGWVDYPDRGRAAVKRLTYNFEDGYVNELELHREETRLGEVPPAERDRQNRVVKSLTALSRTTAAQAAASARQAKTPKEKPIEVSTIHFITGGA